MDFKTLLAIGLAMASASNALSPIERKTARFAILNLPDSAYLQMEVEGFNGGYAPSIDSLKFTPSGDIDVETDLIRRLGNLHVWWSVRETGDTGIPSHIVQITKALPFAPVADAGVPEKVHALRLDTLFNHEPYFVSPSVVLDVPHIDNSNTLPRVLRIFNYVCLFEEPADRKARLIREFVELWNAKRFHAILEPVTIVPFVYVSPWSLTTGTEDLPGIATPMKANRGNWVAVQTQMFNASEVPGDTSHWATFSAEFIPIVKVDIRYDLPTGFVRYVYNKVHNPDTDIREIPGPWRLDSLYKIGPTLEVSGSTRSQTGEVPGIDSLMGAASWLVLTDTSLVSSVDSAMRPIFAGCGGRERKRAWKLDGTTVWLDQDTKIELADLVSQAVATGVSPREANQHASLARISARTGGIQVDLSEPASIRITSASGRVLRDRLELAAGSHAIDLGESHGLVLVQATRGRRTETHRLVR